MSLFEDVIADREKELATCREYIHRLEAQIADSLARFEGKPAEAAVPAAESAPPISETPAEASAAEVAAGAPASDPAPE